ncbi:MAG: sugar transferase [Eubacterium sp.]|nr:sugar transferase [Eubacterium sp.]
MKNNKSKGIYSVFFKRLLDLICGIMTLICFGWLYIILAILVRTKLGSPVLFSQERVGKDGKVFKLYKFRSMTNQCDENGELLPDDVRLTKFGKKLRNTSLDELPEVFNIIKGDMSVIGPRPLLVRYIPYYTEEENRRHLVRPGLSGWAQVNGRSFISWEEKLGYDIEYVDNISFPLDVKIVLMSVTKFFDKSDVEDASKVFVDEDGIYWCEVGDKKVRCYESFDVERERQLAAKK